MPRGFKAYRLCMYCVTMIGLFTPWFFQEIKVGPLSYSVNMMESRAKRLLAIGGTKPVESLYIMTNAKQHLLINLIVAINQCKSSKYIWVIESLYIHK